MPLNNGETLPSLLESVEANRTGIGQRRISCWESFSIRRTLSRVSLLLLLLLFRMQILDSVQAHITPRKKRPPLCNQLYTP